MTQSPAPLAADFIIVGLGSAGCVLADRLSESGQHTVVAIEAGGSTIHPAVQVPALIQKQPTRMNWLYPTQPDPSRGGIADPYSAGKGLGGSSVNNAMLWVRGNPADFDSWAEAGATGWDYRSVLPYFIRAERFEDGSAPARGSAGPVSVARSRIDNPLIESFIDSAGHAGLPVLEDFNGHEQVGASRSQVNQLRGFRHTMANAYLSQARSRPGVTVVTGAAVSRVLVEDGRAVGVEIRDEQEGVRQVRATREVIVAAGAIGSPALLQRSGIGPAEVLAAAGVEVVHDSPQVGRNLMEHPATSLVFEVTGRTVNQEVTPRRLLVHAADFARRGHGALTTTANHALAFAKTPDATGPQPDVELVFMAFGLAAADGSDADDSTDAPRPGLLARLTARSGGREEGRRQVATEPLVTVTAVALHAHGRGTVEIESPDAQRPPRITQSLLGDPHDLAALTAAARTARTVLAADPIAQSVVQERTPGPQVQSDEEWAAHLRTHTFRLFHQAGTCRMGGEDAPVDPRLRVRGVDRLRVVDASVMPSLTSGNTHAPTVMIAERASDLILADQA